MAPKLVSSLFLFAFGAAVGSFLNVVVYRLPAGRSVVSPPSRCPRCGGLLSWYENLPILGWILLRGRCRRCRNPISLQYPLVESIMGLLFAGTYLLLYVPDLGAFA
ncbi:MAG: prepilin peptidase, partial [Planctomycetota bacterium]|nr:prepilin peptidase [Planctomycetota bacterium]